MSWRPRGLIGVVHLAAMPGDPRYTSGGFEGVLDAARRDAEALVRGGVDAIVIENFGSAPFPKGTSEQPTPPHAIAALAIAASSCRALGVPIGINVLRNDVLSAVGIAEASGASFVRVNVHVGAYVTDQGLIEGRAFETLRYRNQIGSKVAILADVRVKHATPLAPIPIATEVGDCLVRGGADAVVVTGTGTGKPVDPNLLREVAAAAGSHPVLIGSGLDPDRAIELCPLANGAIVGTWIKENGEVNKPVDADRVRRLADVVRDRWR
jgi:uncharacterized protein